MFAAVALVLLLTATALAIDIGRLYQAERSLQRAAGMAALDAVQVVSGCTGRGVTGTADDAQAEAFASLARNHLSADRVVAEAGMRDDTGEALRFVPLADGDPRISAVRVTLTRAAPSRILPALTGSRALLLQASAAAGQAPQAGVSLGPSLLSLNTGNTPLLNALTSAMLGGNVALDVAGWRGLAAAQLQLPALAAAAGVATPQELVDVDSSLPDALRLVATALDATGNAANARAADTLQALAGLADPARSLRLGDVLAFSENQAGNAAAPYVDAFSLLMALSQAASEGEALDLPLSAVLPNGLAGLHLAVRITRAPKIAGPGPAGFGPDGEPLTWARTAAVRVQLRADLLDVNGALSGLSPLVGAVAQPIRIGLDAELGAATASVREIHCPALNRPDTAVDVAVETSVARVALGTFTGPAASQPPLVGGPLVSAIHLPLTGPVLSVELASPAVLDVGLAREGGSTFVNDFPLYVALPTPTNPRRVGSSELLGSAGTNLSTRFASQLGVRLLGTPLPAGDVLVLTGELLTPLFGVLDTVVDPLLGLLGAQPGSASVQLFQVEVPRAEVFATG